MSVGTQGRRQAAHGASRHGGNGRNSGGPPLGLELFAAPDAEGARGVYRALSVGLGSQNWRPKPIRFWRSAPARPASTAGMFPRFLSCLPCWQRPACWPCQAICWPPVWTRTKSILPAARLRRRQPPCPKHGLRTGRSPDAATSGAAGHGCAGRLRRSAGRPASWPNSAPRSRCAAVRSPAQPCPPATAAPDPMRW